MSKWQEDILYEITMSINKKGLQKEFDKQLNKMRTQPEHKWKTISEKYEYAFKKIVK